MKLTREVFRRLRIATDINIFFIIFFSEMLGNFKNWDVPSIDFGDPPSKSDKTHYWTFIANLWG